MNEIKALIIQKLKAYGGPVPFKTLISEIESSALQDMIFDLFIERVNPYKHAVRLALNELKKDGIVKTVQAYKSPIREWILK